MLKSIQFRILTRVEEAFITGTGEIERHASALKRYSPSYVIPDIVEKLSYFDLYTELMSHQTVLITTEDEALSCLKKDTVTWL
jgi:hypothetical protein